MKTYEWIIEKFGANSETVETFYAQKLKEYTMPILLSALRKSGYQLSLICDHVTNKSGAYQRLYARFNNEQVFPIYFVDAYNESTQHKVPHQYRSELEKTLNEIS